MIPPPRSMGPPAIDDVRLAKLRKAAVPVGPQTGVVTDFEHGRVLIIAKHPLAIDETVIAFPLSLLLASAAQISLQVAVPMLAKIEHAPQLGGEKAD